MENPSYSNKYIYEDIYIFSNISFKAFVYADTSVVDLDDCWDIATFKFPTIVFGPIYPERGLVSSLKRRAFAVEITDDFNVAYLLLEEPINN